MPSPHSTTERGQIIVVFALAIVAVIGMVGLIIDGGAAFAQQRVAQNGSDGAATAGAVVIAENLGPAVRTGDQVYAAIEGVATSNGLESWTAEYTDDFGNAIGQPVVDTPGVTIPAGAEGVHVTGNRAVDTTFARVLGVTQLTASADTTVVAGNASGDCVVDVDGCTLLPITFPVKVPECDGSGTLLPGGSWIGAPPPGAGGEGYWPIVGEDDLPGSPTYPNGNFAKMAILPLCKGAGESTGAFGWLDLDPDIPNLAGEIDGPLTATVNIPDWFQTQPGNPNSVDDEISQYIRQPVLIPLHNQACQEDPGDDDICSNPGRDPAGANTWYYVHTLGVFYIEEVLVQGANKVECSNPPGLPLVPDTGGAGFLGCLKGWFVDYRSSGPIVPGGDGVERQGAIGIQLVK